MSWIELITPDKRYDKEPSRMERMSRVIGYVMGRHKITQEKLSKHVKSLSDFKGFLTIVWRKEPSEKDKKLFEQAWANEYELEENVEHVLDLDLDF